MALSTFPPSARLKLELMFHGIRYSAALGKAAEHAFPDVLPSKGPKS